MHREVSFDARLRTIKAHNADATQTYKRGVNHLTDRTIDELRPLHGLDRALLFAERAQELFETVRRQTRCPYPYSHTSPQPSP